MRRNNLLPTQNRRDIGQANFAIEKMMAACEISSSCVGVEALLEIDSEAIDKQARKRRITPDVKALASMA